MSCPGCPSISFLSRVSLAQHVRWCPYAKAAAQADGGGGAAAPAAPAGGAGSAVDSAAHDGGDGAGTPAGEMRDDEQVGVFDGGGTGEGGGDEGGDFGEGGGEDGMGEVGSDAGGDDVGAVDDGLAAEALALAKELLEGAVEEDGEDALPAEGAPLPQVPPPPVLPVTVTATLRAGSSVGADLTTRAFLAKPGVAASVGLYGVLLKVRAVSPASPIVFVIPSSLTPSSPHPPPPPLQEGVSGNGFDRVRAHILANKDALARALENENIFTSDTIRGHVATMLGDQGVRAPERVPLQLLGDGFDTTSNFSAAKADVMGQLRLHLLNPNHPTPPLRNPDFVHLFSGQGGEKVDNMANSKAGLAFEASLQRLWALKNGNGTWADPVRIRVENEYPGAKAHLHVVQACLFGDGLAVGEGLHVGFFQMRLKLCTVHPELAFLTSSYLMAGLAETTSMSDRASDATKMNLHDLHAETWAKLGWDHFFDDKYVVLSHGEVAHMGFASLPGELHVFKLALLGLLLDNGEVRNVARTHNCLICNALNTEKDLGAGLPLAVQVPAAVLCARCSSLHAPPARRRRRRRWRRRRRRRRWWRWWRRRQRQGRQQWRRCGRRPAAAFATGRGCAHRYERRPRIGRRPGVCGPACHFCQGRVPQHHNVGSPVACRAACRGRGRGRGREHAPALNSRVAQNGFSKRELGKDAGGRRRYH